MDLVAMPATYDPPTLEDVMAENAALFTGAPRRRP